MPWEPDRKASPRAWHARRRPAVRRLRFPFWAGWLALIAASTIFYLATNPTLWPSIGQGAAYQCWRNAYNCSDFRTRLEAQVAYQACGGCGKDVHRLDEDRDGLACERLPMIPWISGDHP